MWWVREFARAGSRMVPSGPWKQVSCAFVGGGGARATAMDAPCLPGPDQCRDLRGSRAGPKAGPFLLTDVTPMERNPSGFTPSREEFRALAKQGNLVPVYRSVLADMETPVSAFQRLADSPNAFLLESVEGGEHLARYSFLGADPRTTFRSKGCQVIVTEDGVSTTIRLADGEEPLSVLERLLGEIRYVPLPGLPRFVGGAVGTIGWEWVRFLEPIGEHAVDDLGVDDIHLFLTDTLCIFDHVRHRMLVLANASVPEGADVDAAYDDACRRVDELAARLMAPRPERPYTGPRKPENDPGFVSNVTKDDYTSMVESAKELIAAGDIIQVVLAQRFSKNLYADPFDVYRALRTVNPSPYMYYLRFDTGATLVGASPEILVTEERGKVRIRPIAGTRPRGATPADDDALAAELLADEKERAEHIMLVDLARNDIGRVCEYGSVSVDELMIIERYSHVMHIVSNVTGTLSPERNAFDLLRATFPAGTLSGAPKVRAMQIIEASEPTRRGTYGGAIGYFSYSGNLDACITLRTALVKDGKVHVQAGGGIVADSQVEAEYLETVNKSGAVRRAVELAEAGLELPAVQAAATGSGR
jgi:anthranilate synthase component 1